MGNLRKRIKKKVIAASAAESSPFNPALDQDDTAMSRSSNLNLFEQNEFDESGSVGRSPILSEDESDDKGFLPPLGAMEKEARE